MIGGNPNGYLHGMINPTDGTITGNNISYIYPDMKTCLFGRFEDRKMQDSQQSSIKGLRCDDYGLPYLLFSNPDPKTPHFYYEPPSNRSFGAGPPRVFDPYEQKWLEIKVSNDEPKGEGVFTKRDLKPGTLVCSYNGFAFHMPNGELEMYMKRCAMNTTKGDNERRHCVKYSLPLHSRNSQINIPPESDRPDIFIPSYGPKVC